MVELVARNSAAALCKTHLLQKDTALKMFSIFVSRLKGTWLAPFAALILTLSLSLRLASAGEITAVYCVSVNGHCSDTANGNWSTLGNWWQPNSTGRLSPLGTVPNNGAAGTYSIGIALGEQLTQDVPHVTIDNVQAVTGALVTPSGTSMTLVNGQSNISLAFFQNGGILSNGSGIVINGQPFGYSTLVNGSGFLTNTSTGVIFNLNEIDNVSGPMINNGTLLNSFYAFAPSYRGVLNNYSTVDPIYGGGVTNNGTLSNLGILNNIYGNTYDPFGHPMPAEIDNNGTLNNGILANIGGALTNEPGTLNNGSGTVLNNNAGGTFNNNVLGVLNNSGTFNNGGTLNSSGTLNNNSGGVFNNSGQFGLLQNAGTLNNSGILNISDAAGLSNSGILNNYGTVNNGTASPLYNFGGTLNNNPGSTFNDAGTIINSDNGTLNASGTINNVGMLSNSAAMNNAGTLNSSGTLLNFGTLLNAGTLRNSGTVSSTGTVSVAHNGLVHNTSSGAMNLAEVDVAGTLENDGTVTMTGSSPLTIAAGGVLSGSGTVVGDVLNGGTLSPGDSPGIFTIVGNYTQTSTGVYLLELFGPGSGQYDQLVVTGTGTLGGTLDIDLMNGFLPSGQSFEFIDSGGLLGAFSKVDFLDCPTCSSLLAYNGTNVSLTATNGPEPSTLILTWTVLVAVFLLRRRHAPPGRSEFARFVGFARRARAKGILRCERFWPYSC